MRHKNLLGKNNYQVKRLIAKYGDHIPVTDPWRIRSNGIFYRCKKEKIKNDFDHPLEMALYLKSIAPKKCPVFNKPLTTGIGKSHRFSPSVDRIDPRKGYVRGNLQVISLFANYIKQEATPSQLIKFSKWVMEGETNAGIF